MKHPETIKPSRLLFSTLAVLLFFQSSYTYLRMMAIGLVYTARTESSYIDLNQIPSGSMGKIYIPPNARISNWYPEITAMSRPKEWPGLFSYQYNYKWYSDKSKNEIFKYHISKYIEFASRKGVSKEELKNMRSILYGISCGWESRISEESLNRIVTDQNKAPNTKLLKPNVLCAN